MTRPIPGLLRRGAADVRALGPGAPVRALYEASKRAGGHAAVFGTLARRDCPAVSRRVFAAPAHIPEAAAARCLDDANAILSGSVTLFGVTFNRRDLRWDLAIPSTARWADDWWWRVDIRSDARLGDVKWTWELARHRHLVVLARAWHVTRETSYADALGAELTSWLDQNPLERGVNWYSNLELALRALAWLQVIPLAIDAVAPVRQEMDRHLWHTARHLVADLPYTVTSMRNNHMLGDALGLIALGTAFGTTRSGRWWSRAGNRMFDAQLRRHMRDDGSMVEDSLSYHRFVLEMLCIRLLLPDPPRAVQVATVAAAQFLCRLGALEGPLPQYGDWDEGRVLTSSGEAKEMGGSVRLALALCGSGSSPKDRERYDECAWYAETGTPVPPAAPVLNGADAGAGIARAQSGLWKVWLKAGSGPSHGHADLTSVTVSCDDVIVIGDPGTGAYNGELTLRNGMRGSRAHNVVRVDGQDQLVPHRAFRWMHTADGRVGRPIALPSGTLLVWGAHNAYCRMTEPTRVLRCVAVSPAGVAVCDFLERGQQWALTLPLSPSVECESGDSLRLGRRTLPLRVPAGKTVYRGEADPFMGWWSETYGNCVPTEWIEMAGSGDQITWSLTTADASTSAVGGLTSALDSVRPQWQRGRVGLRVATRAGYVEEWLPVACGNEPEEPS